jgi:hypothetical protein
MREPSDTAVALGRLRAARVLPRSEDPGALRRLQAAAGRGGRTLVQVRRQSGPGLVLGWLEGSEPACGPDTGVERRLAPPTVQLTFAACLRACWPDPDRDPFPGQPASEGQILAALAALDPARLHALGDDEGVGGAERHRKSALRQLRAAGFLDPEADQIRLGPAVALWTDADIGVLSRSYSRLPVAPEPQGGRL